MHDDFHSLFAYNGWANRRLLQACHKLDDDQYAAEPVPGWTSVRATVVHILASTDGWLRALSGENVETMPIEADLPTVQDAEAKFEELDHALATLLKSLAAESLETPITLHGRGRSVTLPPWAVLRHVVNHATYHRGQVAAKLRRLGVDPPATDFFHWVLEQSHPKPAS